MNGCNNCKYYRIYRSNSYWDPDESECVSTMVTEEDLDNVYGEAQEWSDDEEPKCSSWEMYDEPEYDDYEPRCWDD